jgi:hypothetical protein
MTGTVLSMILGVEYGEFWFMHEDSEVLKIALLVLNLFQSNMLLVLLLLVLRFAKEIDYEH